MTDPIKAKLVFDERSHLGAFRLHMWHRYRFWIVLRTVASIGAVVGGIILIGIEGLTPFPILMMMVGTFALLRPMVWKIMHARNLRRLPGYGQKVCYTFTPEGIKVQGETQQALIEKNKLYEIVNFKQGLMLYHNKKAYTWIPREAFDSDEAYQQAANVISS